MAKKKRNQFDVDEIYRGLRTNIEFSQMDEAMQVITCVSTVPMKERVRLLVTWLVLWQRNIKMYY